MSESNTYDTIEKRLRFQAQEKMKGKGISSDFTLNMYSHMLNLAILEIQSLTEQINKQK